MPKTTLGQKTLLIIFGLFLLAVLLEVSLRLAGFTISSFREHKNRQALKAKGAYRIMCLGESTTADGGKYSWPSQLEEILNKKNTGINFKVINKGIESADSTFILSCLKENLDRYRPDMVVVMMGVNDGPGTFLYQEEPFIKYRLFIRNFRVYKLTKLLWLHINEKLKSLNNSNIRYSNFPFIGYVFAEEPMCIEAKLLFEKFMFYKNQRNFSNPEENLRNAEVAIKKAILLEPRNPELLAELGDCYTVEGRFRDAENELKKAIEIDPDNALAFTILGLCYYNQEKFPLAEKALKRAIEINPKEPRAYSELIQCYKLQHKSKEIRQLIAQVSSVDAKNDSLYGYIANFWLEQGNYKEAKKYFSAADEFRLKYYNEATRQNYRKLKEMVQERKIALVCVQYPMRKVEPLKRLFDYSEGIIFVDNEKIFKDALRKDKYDDYFRDHFAGDFGHCKPIGNRLLAQNISRSILKECFNR